MMNDIGYCIIGALIILNMFGANGMLIKIN